MSELSIRILRQQVGQIAGTWKAMSVQGTTAQPKLYCECTLCGANQTLDINAWHNEQLGRPTRCLNFARHPAPKAVAPKSQELTIDAINRMPADEYKRRLLHEPGFKDKAEAILATASKPMNTEQAMAAKAVSDKEAKLAPFKELYKNLRFACIELSRRMPTKSLEEFAALPAADMEEIITSFGLRDKDYTRWSF